MACGGSAKGLASKMPYRANEPLTSNLNTAAAVSSCAYFRNRSRSDTQFRPGNQDFDWNIYTFKRA